MASHPQASAHVLARGRSVECGQEAGRKVAVKAREEEGAIGVYAVLRASGARGDVKN